MRYLTTAALVYIACFKIASFQEVVADTETAKTSSMSVVDDCR
ncbi:MAG: hypothetical protein ACI9UA_005165 [Pseudoalteromonas tetraodonis]|jgi:hypothetical protein